MAIFLTEHATNLKGWRFDLLRVVQLREAEYIGQRHRYWWMCECDCGNYEIVSSQSLFRGYTTRCWECFLIHPGDGGHEKHPLMPTFKEMHERCYNQETKEYSEYGGRGITICAEWRNNFCQFVRDMWPRPDGTTLDRKNNDHGYSPTNCRWATAREQADNKRSSFEQLTFRGRTQSIASWAEELGFTYGMIHTRLKKGWSTDEALTRPKRNHKSKYTFVYQGRAMDISELAEVTGISSNILYHKIRKGFPLEKIINLESA